jgi:hypothetical protein
MGWWSRSAAQQIPDRRPEFLSASAKNQYGDDKGNQKFGEPLMDEHMVNSRLAYFGGRTSNITISLPSGSVACKKVPPIFPSFSG